MEDEKILLKYMLRRIESLDDKVDSLLRFKWQIIGGSIGVSVLITIGFNFFAYLMK